MSGGDRQRERQGGTEQHMHVALKKPKGPNYTLTSGDCLIIVGCDLLLMAFGPGTAGQLH